MQAKQPCQVHCTQSMSTTKLCIGTPIQQQAAHLKVAKAHCLDEWSGVLARMQDPTPNFQANHYKKHSMHQVQLAAISMHVVHTMESVSCASPRLLSALAFISCRSTLRRPEDEPRTVRSRGDSPRAFCLFGVARLVKRACQT